MSTRPSAPLWIPPPTAVRGWGRLVRILGQYPVAPLELAAGLAAVIRGAYLLDPVHTGPRTPWDMWGHYGLGVDVLALAYLVAGLVQIGGALYEWQRVRLVAAAVLCGLTTWVICAYLIVEKSGWQPAIHLSMGLAQFWIACRSMPLFPPRNGTYGGS